MSCACLSSTPTLSHLSNCTSCESNDHACNESHQRRIHKQFGVSSSLYTKTLGSLVSNQGSFWHQASDRKSAKGKGVDVKHNSYARCLAKRTADVYKSQNVRVATNKTPRFGNKLRNVGLARAGTCGTCS